jgi:DKNYY family
MKILKITLLLGLPFLLVYFSTFYFKTKHIGGEQGVTPAWYSKNMFYVYISRKGSGGFPSVLGNLPVISQIEGADYNTFEYVDDGFAKDKNYFYYPDDYKAERIELDSSRLLRTINIETTGTSYLYKKYYVINNAVFLVNKHIGGGNSYVRLGLMKGSNINNPVWYPFDYETFTPFSCGYVKDKNGVYYIDSYPLRVIENADTETFTSKFSEKSENSQDYCYATDKNFRYHFFRDKNNNLEIGKLPLNEATK